MDAPPADVLAWVERQVGGPVVGATSMSGGIDAHMFRLSLDGRDDVVLRVTRGGEWDDVRHQAQMLAFLAGTDVPAPRLLAVDTSVGAAGHHVLLQTLLPGDVTLPLTPDDVWLDSLVATIGRLQAVRAAGWMPDRAALRWSQVGPATEVEWQTAELPLVAAIQRLREEAPFTPVLVHDDFWPGNTLREGDQVVGIVDWADAGVGSAARDVTYCAVDLSLCYGLDVGDRLLEAFRRAVDVPEPELLAWSVRAVLMARHYRSWMTGWEGLGVPVSVDAVSARRTELLERARAAAT